MDQFDPDDDDLSRGQLVDHIRELLIEVRRLQSQLTAQEGRVVPALEWTRFPMASNATSGAIRVVAEYLYMGERDGHRWIWWINVNNTRHLNHKGPGFLLREEAEEKAEAAFLRLVGCR